MTDGRGTPTERKMAREQRLGAGAGGVVHPEHPANGPRGLDPKDPLKQTRLSHPRGGTCPGSSDHLPEVELGFDAERLSPGLCRQGRTRLPCARVPCARVPCARVPCARVPCARVPCARAGPGCCEAGGPGPAPPRQACLPLPCSAEPALVSLPSLSRPEEACSQLSHSSHTPSASPHHPPHTLPWVGEQRSSSQA